VAAEQQERDKEKKDSRSSDEEHDGSYKGE
jgi:hypothetical protein